MIKRFQKSNRIKALKLHQSKDKADKKYFKHFHGHAYSNFLKDNQIDEED